MKIVGILQARMGSTRLPGKTLKIINKKPLLWYSIKRLKVSKLISQLIVATSTNKENDLIESFCKDNNIICYRGKEDDVLDRYYQCAKKYNADIIIRLTSDCPLIDPIIVDNTINYYLNNNYDYIKNTWFINSYPSGFDVEVFNFNVLEQHWKNEKLIKNREHVLSSLDNKKFKKFNFSDIDKDYINSLNFDINKIHLSVDIKEDFKLIKKILVNFKDNIYFTFRDVMYYLNNNLNLIKININPKREKDILKIKNNSISN